jgi:hypothetical protein
MGTKYNGLVTFAVLGLLVPFLCARFGKAQGPTRTRPVTLGALFLFTALVVFSPWMIRNSLWKDNPVYPLYNSLFHEQAAFKKNPLPAAKGQTVAGTGKTSLFTYRKEVYGERWWEMALLPVRVFFQGKDGDPRYFDGLLNPFLLLLSIFAFYPRTKDPPETGREKRILLVFAALFFTFAFFTSVLRIRYIAPIIPPLVILSTFGLRNLLDAAGRIKGPGMGHTAHGLVLLVTVSGLAINAHYIIGQFKKVQPFDYISGRATRDEYISRYRREFPAIQYANREVPRNAKILFLFLGKRGYYCDREYIPDTVGQVRSLYKILQGAKDPQDIENRLRKKGITHLLVDLHIFDRWLHDVMNEKARAHAKAFFKKGLVPLYFKNGVGLYALKNP